MTSGPDNNVDQNNVKAGKYLTFLLGEETYGIVVLNVHEIIRMTDVTRVPRTPEFVRGVINLRGKIIPVIDMRRKFGLAEFEDSDRTCVVVVQCMSGDREVSMGLIVDEVSEVLDIERDRIEPTPWLGSTDGPNFVSGMAKVDEGVLILLDIERVLTVGEIQVVGDIADALAEQDALTT